MTAPLPNPFTNSAATQPTARGAADRAVAPSPNGAAARFDRLFDPEKFLRDICVGLADMGDDDFSWVMGYDASDQPPLFLSDPSPAYIEAFHRNVLSTLEDYVRRAG